MGQGHQIGSPFPSEWIISQELLCFQANRLCWGQPVSCLAMSESWHKCRPCSTPSSPSPGENGGPGRSALWPVYPGICSICWGEAIFSSPPQKSSSWVKVLHDLFLQSEPPSFCLSVTSCLPAMSFFSLCLSHSLFSPLSLSLLFSSYLEKPRVTLPRRQHLRIG